MDSGAQFGPEFIPVPNPEFGPVPPYDGNPVNQRCTCGHRAMTADDDELGTTVTEVTVTTTTDTATTGTNTATTTKTVTTRKKYRVDGE